MTAPPPPPSRGGRGGFDALPLSPRPSTPSSSPLPPPPPPPTAFFPRQQQARPSTSSSSNPLYSVGVGTANGSGVFVPPLSFPPPSRGGDGGGWGPPPPRPPQEWFDSLPSPGRLSMASLSSSLASTPSSSRPGTAGGGFWTGATAPPPPTASLAPPPAFLGPWTSSSPFPAVAGGLSDGAVPPPTAFPPSALGTPRGATATHLQQQPLSLAPPPPTTPTPATPVSFPVPRPLAVLMTAEAFLVAPGPPSGSPPLLFTVLRERSGPNRRVKAYRLLLEPGQASAGAVGNPSSPSAAPRPVAVARRRGRTLLSVTAAGSSRPLALLKSNVWGTAYLATAEEGGGSGGGREGAAPPKRQLAAVSYRASSFLGPKGPRQMAALVPAPAPPPPPAPAPAPWPTAPGDAAGVAPAPPAPRRPLAAAAAARDGTALELSNVPPRWSESAGAFTLDFGGRVTSPSVKNFQLVAAGGDDGSAARAAAAAKNHKNGGKRASVLLQFGKTGADTFSMDVRGPLFPLQGFLICLTALDGKLAFE